MTRRNQKLEHLLSPAQQRRLAKLWLEFHGLLNAECRDQKRLNRLRAQMPPGGLSWPWWDVVRRASL